MRIFLFSIFLLIGFNSFSQNKPKYSPRIHDFDFWIGEWKVYKYGTDTIVGYNKIESILDSTSLLENYHVVSNTYKGKSLNKYNPVTKNWEQYWVDNSGLILHLEGKREGNKMIMTGYTGLAAQKTLNRITWIKEDDGTVRQIWEVSSDEGIKWVKSFDGHYKK